MLESLIRAIHEAVGLRGIAFALFSLVLVLSAIGFVGGFIGLLLQESRKRV